MAFLRKAGTMRRETLTDRENQLNVLHQQILLQREALLHTSGSYLQRSTHSAASTATINPAEASIRNARLLKDIENLNQDLQQETHRVPSTKFVTLQNNYWSMVRSLLPLWEQSLSETSSGFSRQLQQYQQHQQRQRQQQQQQQQQRQQQQSSQQLPGQRSQHPRRGKGKSVSYNRATK